MSKKRKRDGAEVNVELVDVYDQLANEDESIRLKAAHKLLTKVYQPDSTTEEQLRSILIRLFRGLCSGRKAARLGFAVALTELLTQVSTSTASSPNAKLAPVQILDILESQTSAEGNTSGQDERDHYFGRVFGAEAIVKSGILFTSSDRTQWKRLLESICSVSQKKPWLRQECGWVLYEFATSNSSSSKHPYIEDIIRALYARKLIRTPEGVAIWLGARKTYPKADLSDHVWKYKHPLARKDLSSLAEIMKNARSEQDQQGQEAQGAATWSLSLHFAWNVVLEHLKNDNLQDPIAFKEFWRVVVDEGLFNANSSPERKLWGMRVWALILAPPASGSDGGNEFLPAVFTRNALHSLISALNGQDRYLRKASQIVLEHLRQRSELTVDHEWENVIAPLIENLTIATDFADIDKLTKTKTVATLAANKHYSVQTEIWSALSKLMDSINSEDEAKKNQHRRYILDLQSKVYSAALKREASAQSGKEELANLPRAILLKWLMYLYGSKQFSTETRNFLQDRLATAFEQALRAGSRGRILVMDAMSSSGWRDPDLDSVTNFDEQIKVTVDDAFTKLDDLRKKARKQAKKSAEMEKDPKKPASATEGVILLYCATLFEVFCGDTEAVEILQDLPGDEISLLVSGKLGKKETPVLCDSLVETLLGLTSRSSKFLRTVTVLIFESLASEISADGIKALARILESKENAQGQDEMFEAVNDDEDGIGESSSEDSDEPDSDVEMVDGAEEGSGAASSSDSSNPSGSESDDENDSSKKETVDPELAAFDAALASTLGTHKPTEDDPDAPSDSDSDMSDSEMLALDEKLAEVFRARRDATSQKKQRQDTKENIVTFKNRTLDLVEVYLKQQAASPFTLDLILPLLRGIRTTGTKQLADRMCSFLRDFCARAKGENIPTDGIFSPIGVPERFILLRAIHDEACFDTSNAHSAAASQASILAIKVLLDAAGTPKTVLKIAVEIYAETRLRMLTEKGCKVLPAFFTDWNNWCVSARGKYAQ